MKTGVVIEISCGRAVLLDSGGCFLSVPADKGWKAGDVVSVPRRKHALRMIYTLAACLALVIALGMGGWKAYYTEIALVSIDVNPSIELSLNRFHRIIAVEAKNREAVAVIAQAAPDGKRYGDALTAIFSAEDAQGFLQSGADIVVAVYTADAQRSQGVLDDVSTSTDAVLAAHHGITGAEYYAVDAETVSGAREHDVTLGKYLYLKQLQQADPQANLAQYTHHSIPELRDDIKACQNRHTIQENADEQEQNDRHGHGHGGGCTAHNRRG